jgi:hypothetical protein
MPDSLSAMQIKNEWTQTDPANTETEEQAHAGR